MRFTTKLLHLPSSLLLLLASHTFATPSGRDGQIPAHGGVRSPPAQYQDLDAFESRRSGSSPVGVMKMSTDEGEKFYMEYWQFEQDPGGKGKLEVPLTARHEEPDAASLANVSMPFRAPLALHTEHESSYDDLKARKVLEGRNAVAALAILEKRAFTCPTGYAGCSAVGYPNSCCSTSETCFVIQDTGLGPVGCCPNGRTCGGTITSCGSNTACADSLGGGCCIPNYVCAGVGCVINPIVVTTTITQVFTVSVAKSSSRLTTVVTTSTSTSSPISSSSSVIQTSSTSIAISGSSSAAGVAPVRPTGVTSSDATTTATDCPVGFYGCSAFYRGGCCRTGRDCDTTSCPPIDSTTIISSGVTIVVPVGSAATVTTPTGACATGWSSCPASVGGNCCPSGFECGTASCSSVGASSTAVAQKASPNAGTSRYGLIGAFSVFIGTFWVGVVLLQEGFGRVALV